MKLVTALVLAALAGCQKAPSVISQSDLDEIVAANPGLTDGCKTELRETGRFNPFDGECFRTMPPRRWKGIWNAGWEWSNFCPAPASTCGVSFEDDEMALQFAKGVGDIEASLDGTFAIEFEGRRTSVASHYGHLGQYPHMIMVDRLVSIRRLEKPKS